MDGHVGGGADSRWDPQGQHLTGSEKKGHHLTNKLGWILESFPPKKLGAWCFCCHQP